MRQFGMGAKAGRLWKKGAQCAIMLLSALLLQGCWDEIDLGDVGYFTALGVDYKDGKYQIYGQMIKFSVVAKTDAPQPDPAPIWIGRGEGRSVLLAIGDMTKGSQLVISMEHLKTVIVHERALSKIEDILDGLNRQRATRYTSLIFGTRSDMKDVLSGETLFDQSPLYNLIYSPTVHDKQRSFVKPYAMRLAVQYLKEPAMTTQLPVISIDNGYILHKGKPQRSQLIDGVFVFKETKYIGYLAEAQAAGLRWINPEFNNYLLEADGKDGRATIALNSSESRIRTVFDKGEPSFLLELRLAGHAVEVDGDISKEDITATVEETVKRQVIDTYETCVTKNMDIYRLEHQLYRYHHAAWKKIRAERVWEPGKYPLRVEVNMNLVHPGKMELHAGT